MSTDTHHHSESSAIDRGFNRAVRWLADRGLNLAGAQTLTVRGRKTGAPQRIPVNPLRFDGGEYLVAARGHTRWVGNARVTPLAQLRRGRRRRDVVLVEVPVAERAPIIRAYLDRWGWEVGRFLPPGLGTDDDVTTISAHADDIPVFAVQPHR